jgi:glycopeptide antibiotics resistance protein
MKIKAKTVALVILASYIGVLCCAALLTRESTSKLLIQTEWFWGYKITDPTILYGDNLINILLYIPIGCLAGLIASKHKLVTAVLLGLFISETIECSQLIWQRGTFDVDDIFNNTVGAFLGGIMVVSVIWIRKKKKEKHPETPYTE